MNMRKQILAVLLLSATLAQPVRAWDDIGHQVVAYIAWQQMTPEAREAVSRILSYAPPQSDLLNLRPASGDHAGMIHFIRSSYWPDLVRDRDHAERYDRYHRGPWHYTNIFWEETEDGFRIREDLRPAEENVVERLFHLEELAREELITRSQKAIIVAWLVHLVGDIHQPLHTSARVTEQEPEGDRGGTLFSLGEQDNLHWYWDRALSEAFEREPEESEIAFVRRIAEAVTSSHPEPESIEFHYESWAERGFRIATRDVYDAVERGAQPPEFYAEMAQRTAAESVALAGYRLGALMNELFGRPENGRQQ